MSGRTDRQRHGAGRSGVEPLLTRLRLWRRRVAARRRRLDDEDDAAIEDLLGADELPLPPARLRHLVAGTADAADFLREGRRHAALISDLAAQAGAPIGPGLVVADIGCGSGRLLRHWASLGATVYGGDSNADLVDWVDTNLPVQALLIGSAPPMDLPSASVDLLVAYSVLTHLDVEQQSVWLADWRRVVRPGGLMICSTHGASRRKDLPEAERRRFDAGQPVVRHPSASGDNLCSAFLPPSAAATRFAPAIIERHREPEPDRPWDQDLWVLRTAAAAPDSLR